jgi:four helix bundle protein
MFDHERLQVYRLAVEFHSAAGEWLKRGARVVRDQLERASLSVVLCIAEGAGRRAPSSSASSAC